MPMPAMDCQLSAGIQWKKPTVTAQNELFFYQKIMENHCTVLDLSWHEVHGPQASCQFWHVWEVSLCLWSQTFLNCVRHLTYFVSSLPSFWYKICSPLHSTDHQYHHPLFKTKQKWNRVAKFKENGQCLHVVYQLTAPARAPVKTEISNWKTKTEALGFLFDNSIRPDKLAFLLHNIYQNISILYQKLKKFTWGTEKLRKSVFTCDKWNIFLWHRKPWPSSPSCPLKKKGAQKTVLGQNDQLCSSEHEPCPLLICSFCHCTKWSATSHHPVRSNFTKVSFWTGTWSSHKFQRFTASAKVRNHWILEFCCFSFTCR